VAAETRIRDQGALIQKLDARIRDLEDDAAHMSARVPIDQAALDACARVFDDERDPRGSGVWRDARSALRATGRLGGLQAASDAAVPEARP
jgi:hypothetical protein